MKRLSFGLLGAAIVATTTLASAQTPPAKGKDKDKVPTQPIVLSGCVSAGTAGNTFLLTNVHRTDIASAVVPDVGVYWLNEPEKLKPHVGHQVEVEGWLDSDTDKTKIKVRDDKVEMKSERGTKKVAAPAGTPAAAAAAATGTSGKQVNYKVQVNSVKMLSATCS